MTAVDIGSYVRQLRHDGHTGAVEFGVPRMHYESQDTWSATVTSCLDWRAEIHLSPLDARGNAPNVIAGYVDFLVLRLGEQPVADVLHLYGPVAAAFAELFDDAWLADGLDEDDEFTGGMPIGTVLLILHAELDAALQHHDRLRPWAVAEVAYAMLPTTTGVVAMHTLPAISPKERHRGLFAADRVDPHWPQVGCTCIPGRPRFAGRATAYRYLEDARAALSVIRQETFRVSVDLD